MDLHEHVARSWDGAEERHLALLASLVRVNSHADNLDGVDDVRRLVAQPLAALGFAVEEPRLRPAGSPRERAAHLVARRPGAGPRVLLIAHLDTVFPPDDPFSGFTRDGDLLRGPGVADIKGGAVVIAAALEALASAGRLDGLDVTVVMNSDEEVGSHASRDLIRQLARGADAALGFEPAHCAPGETVARHSAAQHVIARKGCGRFTFALSGVAAHAGGAHHLGASAIEALARKVLAIHALSNPDRGITTNVGLVRGGRSVNTVAPWAEGGVDFRFDTEEEGGAAAARIRAVLEAPEAVNPQAERPVTCKIEAGGGVLWPPLVPTPASRELSRLVEETSRRLGLRAEAIRRGGASDAAHAAAAGAPAICGLGPVSAAIHCDQEHTSVPALRSAVRVAAGLLARLGELHANGPA